MRRRNLFLHRLDNGGLTLGGSLRLFALAIGHVAGARESRESFDVVTRLLGCGLRLGKIRFGGCHLRFGLAHAAFGVLFCLIDSDVGLLELLLQNRNLLLGSRDARLGFQRC